MVWWKHLSRLQNYGGFSLYTLTAVSNIYWKAALATDMTIWRVTWPVKQYSKSCVKFCDIISCTNLLNFWIWSSPRTGLLSSSSSSSSSLSSSFLFIHKSKEDAMDKQDLQGSPNTYSGPSKMLSIMQPAKLSLRVLLLNILLTGC